MFKFVQKKFLISATSFLTIIGIFCSVNFVLAMPEGTLLYRSSGNGKLYGYNTNELLKIHPFEKDKIELNCGHVGIYVGKDDDGIDYVVEAVNNGVQKTPAKYFVNKGTGEKFTGAKIPIGATKKQRKKIVDIAEKLVEKRLKYDFDFRTQKGPNSEQFICVGLTEKLYESADVKDIEDLVYNPSNYAINITPDGYDDDSVYNSKTGDCFAVNAEYSKISRRASMGEIIGTNCGKEYEGKRYFFLPHTQFLQPSLKDVQIDIQISSDFSSSKIRGLMPAGKIIASWTKNNTVSSTKLATQKVKETGAKTKNKIVGGWEKIVKNYQKLAKISQPSDKARKEPDAILLAQEDVIHNTPSSVIADKPSLNKIDGAEVKVLSAAKEINDNVNAFAKPKSAVLSNKDIAVKLDKPKQHEKHIGVARVIDGDTIVLTTGERVRYIGIDTPELNRPGPDDDEDLAWPARIRNMQLLSAGDLKLVKDPVVDKDKYGRLLRYVYAGGVFVNAQLAREGLAETFFCKPGWKECPVTADKNSERIIRQAISEAEQYNRGLFSEVCEQLKKEKSTKQVIDDNFIDAEKIEPKKQVYLFFGGSGNSTPETEDVEEAEKEIIPEIILFQLYDLISASADVTSSTTVGVNLEIDNSENVNGYFLSASSTISDIDNADWASSSPESFVLDDVEGEKSVYVWIKYGDDNILASTSANIILDIFFPIITFDQAPENFSSSTSAVFEYSANKGNVVLEYKLDNEEVWHICGTSAASTTISNLSEAEHNFSVQGTDLSGRISSSTHNWLIDLTAPIATTTAPISEYEGTNFIVSWEGDDIASSTNSSVIASGVDKFDVQYRIGDGVWIDWVNATTSTSTIFNINVGGGNVVYFRSSVYDKSGNIGLSDEAKTEVKSTIADHVVISEINLGSNSTEWVELYNPTDNNIDLSIYYFCYFASTANWNKPSNPASSIRVLTGIIPAKGFYLIKVDGSYVVNFDHNWGYSGDADTLSNTSGSVGIFSSNPADKTVAEAEASKIDVVAWGSVDHVKEGDEIINFNVGQSIERKAVATSTAGTMQGAGGHQWLGNGYDTDNNNDNFIFRSNPDPRNSNSLEEPWTGSFNNNGHIFYEEDFSDGIILDTGLVEYYRDDNSDWQAQAVENMLFEVGNDEELRLVVEEISVATKIIYNNKDAFAWGNYVLSLDTELNSGVDREIIFRIGDHQNYYSVVLKGSYMTGYPVIFLAKCNSSGCVSRDGYGHYLLGAYGFNDKQSLNNNEVAHIDIEAIGNNIRVFYNNRPVITYEEDTGNYPTLGTIGFKAWSGQAGVIDISFDNIIVRSIE